MLKNLWSVFRNRASVSKADHMFLNQKLSLLDDILQRGDVLPTVIVLSFCSIYKMSENPEECFEKYAKPLIAYVKSNSPDSAIDFEVLEEEIKERFETMEYERLGGSFCKAINRCFELSTTRSKYFPIPHPNTENHPSFRVGS